MSHLGQENILIKLILIVYRMKFDRLIGPAHGSRCGGVQGVAVVGSGDRGSGDRELWWSEG